MCTVAAASGRRASESGTLRHGDGTHGRSDRCRRSFVLPILRGSEEERCGQPISSLGRNALK
jgi:hypothetical protein